MASLSGMTYARNLLEKYGWTEGKGLGKTESGRVEALKPKLKFDNTGIGHDHAEQFTFNWWETAFNDAAKRVSVNTSKGSPHVQLEANDLRISTKRPSIAKLMKENPLKYGKFIKTETLTNGGEVIPVRRTSTISEEDESSPIAFTSNLSDDELFKICGGRTAHKAARHGHKLVGKLARVIEQEKEHLEFSGNSSKTGRTHLELTREVNSEYCEQIKKKKKRTKQLMEAEEDGMQCDKLHDKCITEGNGINKGSLETGPVGDSVDSNGSKKKKRKKKSVYNVEVTEIENKTLEDSKGKKIKCESEWSSLNDNESNIKCQGKLKDVCTFEKESKRRKKKKKSI